MRPLLPALVAVCLSIATGAVAQAPLYTNAELISVDVRTRVIVVRTNDGQSRAMRLEDTVSTAGLRRGDELILAVHDAPGSPRVSRILRSEAGLPVNRTPRPGGSVTTTATAAQSGSVRNGRTTRATVAADASAPEAEAAVLRSPAGALEAYGRRVGALAQQAGFVDGLWSAFASTCAADVTGSYDRAWLALWDTGAVRPDLSSGYCRQLQNQIVSRGQSVNAGMAAAEDAARTAALLPGDVRQVRQQYAMDWSGWGRPAPALLTP